MLVRLRDGNGRVGAVAIRWLILVPSLVLAQTLALVLALILVLALCLAGSGCATRSSGPEPVAGEPAPLAATSSHPGRPGSCPGGPPCPAPGVEESGKDAGISTEATLDLPGASGEPPIGPGAVLDMGPDPGAAGPDPGSDRRTSVAQAAVSPASAGNQPQIIIREIPRMPAAATFEVTSDSALIWAYAPEPGKGRVDLDMAEGTRVGDKTRFKRVSSHVVTMRERTGRTGVVALTRLAPDRRYRYRLQLGNGQATSWYSFRTAPTRRRDARAHFLVGADISSDPRYESAIFQRMAASRAEFLVSLGDWPYTDIPLRNTRVAEYRASHRVARLSDAITPLLRAMPIYAIYDDHEIRDNWDQAFQTEDPERFRAGLTVWDEFFPLRTKARDPLDRRRYRSIRRGRHLQLFMLDTRRYRSPYRDPDSPEKTMLGAEQKAWLERELQKSRATFKVILTSVPLGFGTTADHWSAYALERDALLAFIRDRKIRGVVFLTADQHWFASHVHPGGIHELQVGPLASFLRTPPTEPPPPEVLVRRVMRNYGEIIVTGGRSPRLVFMARDQDGGLIHTEMISR